MSNPRQRLLAPAVLLLAAALSAGCTSDGGGGGSAGTPTMSGSPPTAAPKPVHTTISVAQVVGSLPRDRRRRLQREVGKVVDGWIDAAYVGGRYPRHDFGDSFPGFTPGARAQARHDLALMTNQPLGRHVSSVTATRRRVHLDVLAPHHHAAAVTARVRLDFHTGGHAQENVEVRARLFLTPGRHGWQVFGYDVAKGTPAELTPPKKKPEKKGRDGGHDAHQKPAHQQPGHGKPGHHQQSRQHAKGGGR